MTNSPVHPVSGQHLPFIDGELLRHSLSPTMAVNALQAVLEAGLDPENDSPRTRVTTEAGLFLQMPSTWQDMVGTKLLTISPGNAALNAPVIQGLYALFGGARQAPLAILDGIELTNLRTSAVSAMGTRLVAGSGPKSLVVFGTGVQAWEHIQTFAEVFEISSLSVVGRNNEAVLQLVSRAQTELNLNASIGSAHDVPHADFIVCCTASSEPLFDGTLVSDHAIVVAMGAHEPSSRELDDSLLRRSTVIIESLDSALREAGDIIQGLASGAITDQKALHTLSEVVAGTAGPRTGHPTVFKTTGMPWQDLAVARAVLEVLDESGTRSTDNLTSIV